MLWLMKDEAHDPPSASPSSRSKYTNDQASERDSKTGEGDLDDTSSEQDLTKQNGNLAPSL